MKLTGSARRATTVEEFLRRTNLGQVDTCTGSALEDDSFFAVPVEDRVHGVVDFKNEACAALLRHTLYADVEPDRRVKRRFLIDHEVLQFGVECVGLGLVDEVPTGHTPVRDRVDDTVGNLTKGPLALRRSHRSAEILLRQDVRRVEAPRGRDLDVELLESNFAGVPIRDDDCRGVPTQPAS